MLVVLVVEFCVSNAAIVGGLSKIASFLVLVLALVRVRRERRWGGCFESCCCWGWVWSWLWLWVRTSVGMLATAGAADGLSLSFSLSPRLALVAFKLGFGLCKRALFFFGLAVSSWAADADAPASACACTSLMGRFFRKALLVRVLVLALDPGAAIAGASPPLDPAVGFPDVSGLGSWSDRGSK